ncbi:MAG: Polysaccharide export lipoprotein wza [uncultured bacterium]|nr:MAG: Polysaccharide export lipoprotein wza [uncultured bacterium]OGT25475.1 MAG: hypothetical protein A3B71_05375 [Gammaproteobacteria bacterium RIFCSPHIGHO2_02_FULL_42_43]OGT51427.1 MAG: hypothetical protein A3E54_05140 [Gammaproteobacteria bacterium RIFCSPHIGHO2_12_FULL_41_25]OGT62129.1 MAG: hypothetical protein A3I77_04075 [Gammaproteobacteria bacterium RIFCSPLOWO2_02_FULL_42_14]
MEWIRRALGLLFLACMLVGCSTFLGTYMNPSEPSTRYQVDGRTVQVRYVQLTPNYIAQHRDIPTYHVGPYDILNIIVWDHPEITTITTQLSTPEASGTLVNRHGDISFPFAGIFNVNGLTISNIQTVLEKRLSKYIRTPQVTVRVVGFRSQQVQMMGEMIGGTKVVSITDKPLSLLDAINNNAGTSILASNTAKIFVLRGTINQITVYALDARSPENMMLAEDFYLQNRDIVYVPPLGIANWNNLISQLSSTLAVPGVVKSTENTF